MIIYQDEKLIVDAGLDVPVVLTIINNNKSYIKSRIRTNRIFIKFQIRTIRI